MTSFFQSIFCNLSFCKLFRPSVQLFSKWEVLPIFSVFRLTEQLFLKELFLKELLLLSEISVSSIPVSSFSGLWNLAHEEFGKTSCSLSKLLAVSGKLIHGENGLFTLLFGNSQRIKQVLA